MNNHTKSFLYLVIVFHYSLVYILASLPDSLNDTNSLCFVSIPPENQLILINCPLQLNIQFNQDYNELEFRAETKINIELMVKLPNRFSLRFPNNNILEKLHLDNSKSFILNSSFIPEYLDIGTISIDFFTNLCMFSLCEMKTKKSDSSSRSSLQATTLDANERNHHVISQMISPLKMGKYTLMAYANFTAISINPTKTNRFERSTRVNILFMNRTEAIVYPSIADIKIPEETVKPISWWIVFIIPALCGSLCTGACVYLYAKKKWKNKDTDIYHEHNKDAKQSVEENIENKNEVKSNHHVNQDNDEDSSIASFISLQDFNTPSSSKNDALRSPSYLLV